MRKDASHEEGSGVGRIHPDSAFLERRLKLEAILYSVSDDILSVDGALRVRSFNRSSERIVDLKAGDAVGLRLAEVFRPEACDLPNALAGMLRRGDRIEDQEVTVRLVDGTRRWLVVSADPITDEEVEPAGAWSSFATCRSFVV